MDHDPADALRLDASTRAQLWQLVGDGIEAYRRDADTLDVTGTPSTDEVRQVWEHFDFDHPLPPAVALERAMTAMRRLQPHVTNPRYFGLFEPAPTAMGVVAAALAAAFNPCLATRAGSPVGMEAERLLVERFGDVFGYRGPCRDGTLTSGGSESNLTGLLLALAARVPEHRDSGLRQLGRQPVVYLTEEAHPSWLKAIRITGLGGSAAHLVPMNAAGVMDCSELAARIAGDRAGGRLPLMVIATAGSTVSGVVDPIDAVAGIAAEIGLWLHVDAAWGGAVMLLPERRAMLAGIERADSITFDPHKWLSVPLGCGMLLTRHLGLLERAFGVSETFLTGGSDADGTEPFDRSMRWSRSFSGLLLLLSLGVAGWQGYREVLRRQIRLADRMREQLTADGWEIVNRTALPVVCFRDADDDNRLATITAHVNGSGQARIFQVRVRGRAALRACVTNYATTEQDIDLLIALLARARADVDAGRVSVTATQAGSACSTGLSL